MGQQANQNCQRNERGESIDHAKRQSTDRAENESDDDDGAPAKPVGQCPANHAAKQAEYREQPEDQAGFGHADAEFLGDVQGEEWKEQRPADPVDEGNAYNNPELARKLVINLR